MLFSLLKKISQQVGLSAVILLILFAAYLSVGRQFFPAISRYKSLLEDQLYQVAGFPVSIDALGGYFEGFSPVISIDGLRILIPPEVAEDQTDAVQVINPDAVLELGHATVIIDVAGTLARRQLAIDNFLVDGLEIQAQQDEAGNWQLRGVNTPGGESMSLGDVFNLMKQVTRMELGNLVVNLQTAQGIRTRLHNGLVVIQNQGSSHFFHLNFNVGEQAEQVMFSVEVVGDDIADIKGTLHLSIPEGDYAHVLGSMSAGGFSVAELQAGGQVWLDVRRGQMNRITAQLGARQLELATPEGGQLNLQDVSARAALARTAELGWQLDVENLGFAWQGQIWPPTDAHLLAEQDGSLRLHAQQVDLGMLAGMALASGALPGQAAGQIAELNPRGKLIDMALSYPMGEVNSRNVSLAANLVDVALESFQNAPSLSGVSGYLQIAHDRGSGVTSGFAEVDSPAVSINIPTVFLDTWQYDHVNGRIDFRVDTADGTRVRIVSNVIDAQSEIVTGRVQFASDRTSYPDGRRAGDFTLLVGARDADGSRMGQYLPSTPGQQQSLLNAMGWLDRALLDADVGEAGVIFRGATVPGSRREAKTFQGYFGFTGGQLKYAQQWPELDELEGIALISDDNTDIRVLSGSSAGLELGFTTGQIRRLADGASWLTIEGAAGGETARALGFLIDAPLAINLDDVMGDWDVEGAVQANLGLRIPLNRPDETTWISVDADLVENRLSMPELALQFDELGGEIMFNSDTGLAGSELTANFFGQPASISLSSPRSDTGAVGTRIDVAGRVEAGVLAAWPRHAALVRDFLQRSDGEFNYSAALEFTASDNGPATQSPGTLHIRSDLRGLAINLPQPLGKAAEQTRSFQLQLGIGGARQPLALTLGAEINGRLDIVGGAVEDGIIYVGTMPGVSDPWRPRAQKPGMEIRGNLDRFNVGEWMGLLETYAASESEAESVSDRIALIQLDIGTLDLFGQVLEAINVEVQHPPGTDYWSISLDGDAVSGSVLVPFDRNDYIDAFIAYLRLPGSEPKANPSAASVSITPDNFVGPPRPRVDALAGLDPRRFPRLRFYTGDFSIGDRDYGLGQFTLDPTETGAEFTNLIVNFRGLQFGLEEAGDARFVWRFDGQKHHSHMEGLITAGNLAEVLAANGFAPSLESTAARFEATLDWPGSPAFFSSEGLSGDVRLEVRDGRFLQGGSGSGALKLISILNFDAIMRRLRFSDDLLRRGLAYDEITGNLVLKDGIVNIRDRVVISGPSSVYQIGGQIDLVRQTINGDMYLTLPVSDNIPWLGLLTANIPLAIGAYLFDRIFGDQVDNLTTAQYTLQGPWEGLQPQFRQAFGTPTSTSGGDEVPASAVLN